jgi:hypothetical protein
MSDFAFLLYAQFVCLISLAAVVPGGLTSFGFGRSARVGE